MISFMLTIPTIQLSQEQTDFILERLKRGSLDLGYVYLLVKDEDIEIVARILRLIAWLLEKSRIRSHPEYSYRALFGAYLEAVK
ncbi:MULTISPECIES: hypothetical protein [unclassified Paenibacillus]|uniref:hypothetical protein n=2 Tax=unclassified Paenibacillus TaxID=185978 RepID=UPI0024B8866A|nr:MULTISPECIES: hypothetical protein [unclassified Paenibacillus]